MHSTDLIYARYWHRKQLRGNCPPFPVLRCSGRFDGQVLSTVSKALASKSSVLDVGAGNFSVRETLRAAGFTGEYRTLDVGSEQTYDYRTLDEVEAPQEAILILDVLEHLPLAEGLRMLERAIALLAPSGVLVVQTPNGRCVRAPFVSDMTHVHAYNLPDLWAYITSAGCDTAGFRVSFEPSLGLVARARSLPRTFLAKAVITQLLGLDYADNIMLVARKN
jgi:2-polyprenyl-3-methyl-5-hydroxy-6-metoxy-1,4-benzoquinol methylase